MSAEVVSQNLGTGDHEERLVHAEKGARDDALEQPAHTILGVDHPEHLCSINTYNI